jgi:hypothetical protein
MKIPQEKNPGVPQGPATLNKSNEPAQAKPKAFAEKLKKGSDLKKNQEPKGPVPPMAPDIGVLSPQFLKQNPIPVAQAGRTDFPPAVQNLSHEIEVVTKTSDASEVNIQFDSKTFDGLKVNIRKEDSGSIAITFQTNNDSTTQVLSKHLPELSQSLAAKGIPISAINLTDGKLNETFSVKEVSESAAGFNSSSGSEGSSGRPRKRR